MIGISGVHDNGSGPEWFSHAAAFSSFLILSHLREHVSPSLYAYEKERREWESNLGKDTMEIGDGLGSFYLYGGRTRNMSSFSLAQAQLIGFYDIRY